MNCIERRLAIIDILAERRKETMFNLAFELNVDIRTIRSDILQLSLSYPLETKKGNGGGVYVPEGFSLHRRFLNESEKILLEKILPTLDESSKKIMEGIIKGFSRKNK